MSLRKVVLLLIFLLTQKLSFAFQADSATVTVPSSIRFIHEIDYRDGNPVFQKKDTSLYKTDRVHLASDNSYNYLGVPGSAAQSPWFVNLSELYTRPVIRSYDIYTIPKDSVKYYSVNKKFTDIQYHSGTFKELVIDILHTQNITKNWNAGIFFSRFSVKDYMFFSDTYKGTFLFFTSFSSNNKKYNLFAHAYWNTIENQVNGGLSKDSLYLYGNVDNIGIRGLGWKISDAEQAHRSRRLHLNQFYDLSGSKTDSSGNKTSVPAIRLNHNVTFERTSLTYKDDTPDSSFYENFFFSPTTFDSLHADQLTNEFAIILPADKQRSSAFFRNWSMSAAAEYVTVHYEDKFKNYWDNLAVSGKIISKYDSSDFTAVASMKYVVRGFNEENYQGDAGIQSKQYGFGSFGFAVRVSQYSPDFYLLKYISNNFIWTNGFSKTNNVSAIFNYTLSKYKFSISAGRQIINDPLYIDKDALPQQSDKKLNVDQIKIEKNFVFRSLRFYNFVGIQKGDNEDIIHLDPLFTRHSLFIEKAFFGKKLLTDIGFNIAYSSEYFADAFMPATALFYYQTEMKTGGYLRADLFVRAKIKSAEIFLKMENINDNMGKKSYFLVPHYAQPGNVFRFGVSWRFFDQ